MQTSGLGGGGGGVGVGVGRHASDGSLAGTTGRPVSLFVYVYMICTPLKVYSYYKYVGEWS